jgi:hypothetical protein
MSPLAQTSGITFGAQTLADSFEGMGVHVQGVQSRFRLAISLDEAVPKGMRVSTQFRYDPTSPRLDAHIVHAFSVRGVPLARIGHKLLTNTDRLVEHDVTVLSHHSVTTGIRCECQRAVGEQEDGSAAAHTAGAKHFRPHRHRDDGFAGRHAFHLDPHRLACAICRPHCIGTFLRKDLSSVIVGHESDLASPTNRDCIVYNLPRPKRSFIGRHVFFA